MSGNSLGVISTAAAFPKGEDKNQMAEVIIFGGTREGRELAEYAAGHAVPALVSVAGTYGSQMLGKPEGIPVHCGRLDASEMEAWFVREQPGLVLDATHPHAVLVTRNIRTVCEKLGIPYRRVLRDRGREEPGQGCVQGPADQEKILWVDTAREAAGILNQDEQPVLLTTGSKELGIFLSQVKNPGRIFARVLPDSRVLGTCEALGIAGSHVIAMQGPFSVEMNCALIRMAGAGWLVTKDSGKPGGYLEKLKAAQLCGIRTIVIRRPRETEGICLEEAKGMLDRFDRNRHGPWQGPEKQNGIREGANKQVMIREEPERPLLPWKGKKRHLALIGMGMGGGSQLTAEAMNALSQAQVVFGAGRMLEDVKAFTGQAKTLPCYKGEEIAGWLTAHEDWEQAAAVYSGDTGFYSGCASLLEVLGQVWKDRLREAWEIRVFPGISTVSCLCARFQISYENLYLASAHGREWRIRTEIQKHPRIFLLLGSGENLAKICRDLCAAGYEDTRVMAGVRLGYPDEELLTGMAKDFCQQRTKPLAAVILERAPDCSENQDGAGEERQNA